MLSCCQKTLDQRQIHVSRHRSCSPSHPRPEGESCIILKNKIRACVWDFSDLNCLCTSQVWNVAKPYIDKYETEYFPESRPVSPTAFSLEPPPSPRKRLRHEWKQKNKQKKNLFLSFFAVVTTTTIFTEGKTNPFDDLDWCEDALFGFFLIFNNKIWWYF